MWHSSFSYEHDFFCCWLTMALPVIYIKAQCVCILVCTAEFLPFFGIVHHPVHLHHCQHHLQTGQERSREESVWGWRAEVEVLRRRRWRGTEKGRSGQMKAWVTVVHSLTLQVHYRHDRFLSKTSPRMTFTIPTVLEELQHIKSVMWTWQYKISVIFFFF